jgi:predicted  nucleic acid-binding Zn-ribbon protein
MSVRIPIETPGLDDAERSLAQLDQRIDQLRSKQVSLRSASQNTGRSLSEMARQADNLAGEIGDLGRTTDKTTGDVEDLNKALKDVSVDSRTGILGVAGSIEQVQSALQDTDDSAEDLARRFGQGGVFATAQAEAEDLAGAIKRNLKDAFRDAFDDGGQGLQDLVGDADQLKERLSQAFGSIQSNVSASASAQGEGGGLFGSALLGGAGLFIKDRLDKSRLDDLKGDFQILQTVIEATAREADRLIGALSTMQRSIRQGNEEAEKYEGTITEFRGEVEKAIDTLRGLGDEGREVAEILESKLGKALDGTPLGDEVYALEDKLGSLGDSSEEASGALGTLGAAATAARTKAAGLLATLGRLAASNPYVAAISALAAVLAGPFVAGLALASRKAAEFGQQLRVAASQTSIASEQIQELYLIAQQLNSEVDFDTVRDSFKEFSVRLSEAQGGAGEAAEAFTALGLTQEELKEQTPTETYAQVIDQLRGLTKESRQYRGEQVLGAEAFEQLSRVINLTKEEYEDYRDALQDVIISDEVRDQLDAITAAYTRQNQKMDAATQRLTAEYGPALARVAGFWTDIKVAVYDAITAVERYLDILPDADPIEGQAGTGTAGTRGGAGEEDPGDLVVERIQNLKDDRERGLIDTKEFYRRYLQAVEDFYDQLREQDAPDLTLDAIALRIKELRRQVSDLENPRPGVPAAEEPEDTLIPADDVDPNQPLPIETQEVENSTYENVIQKISAIRRFYSGLQQDRRVLSVLERTVLGALEDQGDITDNQLGRLQAMIRLIKERIDEKERELALDAKKDEILRNISNRLTGLVGRFYDSLIDESESFGAALRRAGEQALRDIVTGSAAAAFKELLDSDGDDAVTVFDVLGGGSEGSSSPGNGFFNVPTNNTQSLSGAQTAAGAFGAGTTGVGVGQAVQRGTGSKLAGGLAGGATSALLAASLGLSPLGIAGLAAAGLFGGFFASGGRPPQGKASVVGEAGPELFIPDTPGRIIPNDQLRPPQLPQIETDSGLRDEVRRLRESTEAALDRPARAYFTPREFRDGQRGAQRQARSKSPRTTRR